MNNISNEEKIELLETWKSNLQSDIDRFNEEVQNQLDKKNKSIAAFNVRLKNMTDAITRAQNRVDKTRLQLDTVEQEIIKAKENKTDD